MNTYSYSAVDAQGKETRGTIEVANPSEALKRIKEMGFFPVKVTETSRAPLSPAARAARHRSRPGPPAQPHPTPPGPPPPPARLTHAPKRPGRVRVRTVTLFTRQLATLLE